MKPDLFGLLLLANPNAEIKPLFETKRAHDAWIKRFRDKMRPIIEQHARAHAACNPPIIFGPPPKHI